MYLHSITGLHKAIQATDHYQQKRPSEKPVLIDKVNFFIDSIYNGNRHIWDIQYYEPVPLHYKLLRKMLGRYEADVIVKLLQELDIIEVDENYRSTTFIKALNSKRVSEGKKPLNLKPESKKYGLTPKAKNMTITKVGVLSQRMEKKIFKFRKETLEYYMQDTEVHSKVINSLMRLRYNPNHSKAQQALLDAEGKDTKKEHYQETHQTLQELNQYTTPQDYIENSNFYYKVSEKVGRVFHYFGTIPKGFRESLSLKDGGKLSEIDLNNSQPLIIALNYLNGKSTHTQSDKMLLEDVMGSNFYKRIAQQALNNNDSKTYNLFIERYKDFKAKVLGDGLYFNYIPTLDKIRPMERYLLELYPQFMQHIRTLKLNQCKQVGYSEGFKIVAQEAQLTESGIFIEGIYKDLEPGIFAVPVHDSLIVESDKVDFFIERLVQSFKAKFNIEEQYIRPLFDTTEY